jgi:hypothetical protein
MAARKKPVAVETPAAKPIADDDSLMLITRNQLEIALRANMMHKTGSQPIEGQLDDLWRRLTQAAMVN